jgi:glycosyltransferase involved in cell wall biosynthesis
VHNGPQIREVAIILPCYNVEAYLPRALDSVLAQTHTDFHTYAVDDGSLDGTVRVLAAYQSRCSFVSQAHAGPGAARNHAIQMSDSPFVAFLDADDEWLPEKLQRQIARLKEDPDLGLVCSLCRLSDSGKQIRLSAGVPGMPLSGKLFEYLARDCFVFTPTVVVRRRCLEQVGLFNESLAVSEDFNLWLRIAARWKIAVLPEVLAINHRRPESLSGAIAPEERLRSGVASLEDVESRCRNLSPGERRALHHALAERKYFHGSFLLTAGEANASRQELRSVLRLRPLHWRALVKLALTFFPRTVYEFFGSLRTRPLWNADH